MVPGQQAPVALEAADTAAVLHGLVLPHARVVDRGQPLAQVLLPQVAEVDAPVVVVQVGPLVADRRSERVVVAATAKSCSR